MLNRSQRTAILELHRKQIGVRQIARTLHVSRQAVRRVLASQSTEPPPLVRAEKAEPYRNEILQLYSSCKGNLARVHEELRALGANLGYPTLTAFCRKEQIGQEPKKPAGQYHFDPGEEMQHDTSPHRIQLGGVERLVQIAAAVLCYSRMLFFQCYPTFQRFDCKVFLTDAFLYFAGTTRVIMIDNTHVVVLRGTGAEMVPVPEMAAFAERYSSAFVAHEKGDANRSARVEGPFSFIQRNFFAGRTFSGWDDLNAQARAWCDKVNSTYKKHLRAIPRELYAVERPALTPLPLWVPEVYRLHQRIVDLEGYVSLHSNRYSVPPAWIGRQVQVRETKDHVEIEDARRGHVRHRRLVDTAGQRQTLPEHRLTRGQAKRPDPAPEETALRESFPELADYVTTLKKRGRQQTTLALRQLVRLSREYPREAFLRAAQQAAQYGLFDLDRLERMVLRLIAHDYFRLDPEKGDDDDR
jgi:transposase